MPTCLRKLNVSQRDAALLLIVAGPGSGKISTMVARILTLLNELKGSAQGVDSKNNDLHNSCCNGGDGPRRCCGGEGGVQGTYDLDVSFLLFATLSLSCGECTATPFFHTALAECHNTWAYVLVDEFQDTSVMQYKLLSLHGRVTVVGSDIISFNGANSLGFSTFRNDVPNYKEVRPHQNYRSTGCIVEAARCVIQHNDSGCSAKVVRMDDDFGEKTVVMECRNEEAQCAFVVDEILEKASVASDIKPVFANFAILYRQQVTGKIFQSAFRSRKIPFNMHGVAVYCKKVVKDVIALLWTSLGRSGTVFERREQSLSSLVTAVLNILSQVLDYLLDDISQETKISCYTRGWKTSCIVRRREPKRRPKSGRDNFREQAEAEAKKALEEAKDAAALVNELEEEGKELARQEAQAVANAQKAKDKAKAAAASLEALGAKMMLVGGVFQDIKLSDRSDQRVSNIVKFSEKIGELKVELCPPKKTSKSSKNLGLQEEVKPNSRQLGCSVLLKAFLDHIIVGETENFRTCQEENHNSVTMTTMHQSKGLEWDRVFIVKANELETPLLHESSSLETSGCEEQGLYIHRNTLYHLLFPLAYADQVSFTGRKYIYFYLYLYKSVKWEKLPAERQEYCQQKCSERTMGSVPATAKQIAFLRRFGCTVNPSSRLHASKGAGLGGENDTGEPGKQLVFVEWSDRWLLGGIFGKGMLVGMGTLGKGMLVGMGTLGKGMLGTLGKGTVKGVLVGTVWSGNSGNGKVGSPGDGDDEEDGVDGKRLLQERLTWRPPFPVLEALHADDVIATAMQELRSVTKHGWPDSIHLPSILQPAFRASKHLTAAVPSAQITQGKEEIEQSSGLLERHVLGRGIELAVICQQEEEDLSLTGRSVPGIEERSQGWSCKLIGLAGDTNIQVLFFFLQEILLASREKNKRSFKRSFHQNTMQQWSSSFNS
ncbi:hypothetical protein SELMODRAFT_440582 [Selaginella moellendorffii]|uniref:DNA 3'-5' helicase n=1 Tax=Selaginella moellendorffii TaxID=88036 RepID=D8RCR5_SELML|nr:hypothetical protein SELMODRAFT_440582 [Selaginella moellendorffii]